MNKAIAIRQPHHRRHIKSMNPFSSKSPATPQTPVFPPTLHTLRPNPKAAAKAIKRDNVFSKSRDTREDRGTREMKTSHNDQTNHAR
jgi:hypothetical protein